MASRAPVHKPKRFAVKTHGVDWSKPWAKGRPTQRLTGRALQRARARLFARDPLCAECTKHNRVRLATQRDHIIPLAEGGADDETNEQGLCDECHLAKTLREAARARTHPHPEISGT